MTELRLNADGSLDEVVSDTCSFHLEQMSDTHWWMAVETKEGIVHISFHSKSTIVANVDDERGLGR